jgi:hypothetical protein
MLNFNSPVYIIMHYNANVMYVRWFIIAISIIIVVCYGKCTIISQNRMIKATLKLLRLDPCFRINTYSVFKLNYEYITIKTIVILCKFII